MKKEKLIGIIEQINNEKIYPYKKIRKKELQNLLDDLSKNIIKNNKRINKIKSENYKHLIKRSKKLNEPIPIILEYYLLSIYPCCIPPKLIKEYKIWFD